MVITILGGYVPGPTATFGFILATLCGAIFHLIMGGDARRLALFLLAGWVGFLLGHILGGILGITLVTIGMLRVFPAILGALIALVVAQVLTSRRTRSSASRPRR
ncbi:MAG: hypothetical protein H6672_09300 [Anaerolineaceae bacterium]|nr:hypothetical protein [Anaerolineaceae bacterium]